MGRLKLDMPSERQKLFLKSKSKYVAFGGARGGGKSWAVRTKAVLLCLKHPGIKVLLVRKTYPELQENHIAPLCALLKCYAPAGERLAKYNEAKKYILFSNGSRIIFRYCENDRDAERFQGTEADVLFVDEATGQSEERIKKLTACVRGANAFPKRIYYTCNPGGEGHGWVKRLFIDRRFFDNERPEDYEFIRSLVTDNRALMEAQPDYLRQLEALPKKLREAWLMGNWDIFEGQFFEDFLIEPELKRIEETGFSAQELKKQHRWCHVIPAMDMSTGERRGWSIMRSYDFGYNKPFSMAYWAADYDGVLYRILEVYGCTGEPDEGLRLTPEEQFRRFAELERTHPWLAGKKICHSVADPAIWDASRGESIAETAARYGIYFTPGDNRRIPGWMQLHYRLQFDDNGYARMYIFDSCKAFIRTLPLLSFSKSQPEDLDTGQEDHAADEARYLCMSRPVAPARATSEPASMKNPLG